MKKVAVIVINYNGKKYLQDCFKSLLNQTYKNFEIHLLDNASTDGSVEYTINNFPSVKIIKMEKNYGFAEGYNRAISTVDSEYIAILNNDTILDKKWLENLARVINENENVAIAGGKICLYDTPEVINSAGIKLTFAGVGFDIGFGLRDNDNFNKTKFVGAACGASMLIKKAIFDHLGGFDSDYFLICEDTDLCWRAWLKGYRVIYEPSSIVYHKFGEKIGKRETPLRIFYSQRNAIISLLKNLGLLRLIISLNIVLAYTLIKLTIYTFLFKRENTKALLKGTISVISMLQTTLSKRRIIQKERKISDRFLEMNGLMASFKEAMLEYLRVSKLWLRF